LPFPGCAEKAGGTTKLPFGSFLALGGLFAAVVRAGAGGLGSGTAAMKKRKGNHREHREKREHRGSSAAAWGGRATAETIRRFWTLRVRMTSLGVWAE